jgi:ParB-like chromosome segregation protein Spo0J
MMPAVEERIGKYRVHPVAAMFPLIEGEEYEKFRDSIRDHGQQQPVIVQGDMLIDGRNRMRVCVELDREPITREYDSTLPIHRYILTANIWRRELTKDQRTQICSKAIHWAVEDRNRQRKLSGKSADGEAGGRGRKRNLHTNSDEGFSKRDAAAENARSTVGQIAEAADTTRHKAAQAVAVSQHSEELADQVIAGAISLKDAAKRVPKKTRAKVKPRPFNYDIAVQSALKVLRARVDKIPPARRKDFVGDVLTEVKKWRS